MKKLIYVSLEVEWNSETYERLARMADDALEQFQAVSAPLMVKASNGQPVIIERKVDFSTPEDHDRFYNASVRPIGPAEYEIVIGGGLLARFDVISRALVADKTVLRGAVATQLTSKEARKSGRKEVLTDFVWHYLVSLTFWHEMAHVILGHIDWLVAKKRQRQLSELPCRPMSPEDAAERRVLEADADHQAAKWAVSMFDLSLDQNPNLKYKTLADRFHDFGYLLVTLFQVFGDLDPGGQVENRTHPTNDTRMVVSLAFIREYLEKYRPDQVDVLMDSCMKGGLSALGNVAYSSKRVPDLFGAFQFMMRNGEEIERLGVRRYQMLVTGAIKG